MQHKDAKMLSNNASHNRYHMVHARNSEE